MTGDTDPLETESNVSSNEPKQQQQHEMQKSDKNDKKR